MLTTEQRLSNLESLVNYLSKQITQTKGYAEADTVSERIGISNNTTGVSDNELAICDVADLADTNSMAIDDLAELVDELSNKVAEMES